MDLAPGTLVGNNVRLKRLLGQGGMGSVWVADHLGLETEVAVKFISADLAKQGEAMARFQREASAAAQLRSPHVVQVFDHGITPDGMPYIVMELLEGEDLMKRIERLRALPVPEVVAIMSQACKALGKAHTQGVIHRDIKPDNIFLIDSDGDIFVKVLDFGIAKRAQDAGLGMTSTGTMVGTPYYMSPEQVLSSKAVDLRSDLWSMAVVAYNALTGTLPFTAETLGALCVAISNGKFEPPTKLRADLPPMFDTWFEKALNRDPNARFASAKELSETFTQAAGLGRPQLGSVSGVVPFTQSAVAASTAVIPAQTPGAFARSSGHTLRGASVTASRVSNKAALMALIGVAAGIAIAAVLAIVIFVGRRSSASVSEVEPSIEAASAAPIATASITSPPAPSASVTNVVVPPAPAASSAEPTPIASAKPTVTRSSSSSSSRSTGAKSTSTSTRPSKDRYGF